MNPAITTPMLMIITVLNGIGFGMISGSTNTMTVSVTEFPAHRIRNIVRLQWNRFHNHIVIDLGRPFHLNDDNNDHNSYNTNTEKHHSL